METTAGIPFLDTLKLVGTLGLPTVLVMIFVWWTWIREARLAERVTSLESFINEKLLQLIQTSSESHVKVHTEIGDLCEAVKNQTIEITKTNAAVESLNIKLSANPFLLRTDKKRFIEALDRIEKHDE